MFGIGLLELVVIAVLGVLVFGPDKVPDLARQAAGLLKTAKKATDSVRDELRENLGPEFADLEITDLHPRSLVRKHMLQALEDVDDDDEDDEDDENQDDENQDDENDQIDEDDQHAVNHLSEREVS